MKYDYISIAMIVFTCIGAFYIAGDKKAEEEFWEAIELASEDGSKVYLDVQEVLHVKKRCNTYSSTSDNEETGWRGVKFIDKINVDRQLIDTISICRDCISNEEYDKLYNGIYLSEIEILRLQKLAKKRAEYVK